ncbi:MAG TPA: hemolysin family protein [Actinomycetota bacterium]
MTWLWGVVVLLVLSGSLLAMAETSISRMNRVRAMALREEGRKNAVTLERIETDPARYLNSVYLAVMFAQNGSAILVATLVERRFSSVWVTVASVGFTILYFVIVEAMAKTFGILHSDRVALALSPFVAFLSRLLSAPTRALIGLANVLLPGKGLKQGPFVSEEDIRSMADVGHEEGAIEEGEKELIHSIFEFGDTVVREVMVPRPDMVTVEVTMTPRQALTLMLKHGFSRVPAHEGTDDNIVGLVYAKDIMRRLSGRKKDVKLADILRPAIFVPDSKRISELLREMQKSKTHMAIVSDEYGDVAGLVTIEDLLEEIVGEIADEYDREEPSVQPVDESTIRVNGHLTIEDLNEVLDTELPNDEWDTVGGLMAGILGKIPQLGDEVTLAGITFRAERVQGRRIAKVLIHNPDGLPEAAGE